jgi:hypothetical protein
LYTGKLQSSQFLCKSSFALVADLKTEIADFRYGADSVL